VRDRALLLFLYNTGARVQEAADLRVEHVDLERGPRARLHGKGGKWRTCPLWDETSRLLRHRDRGAQRSQIQGLSCAKSGAKDAARVHVDTSLVATSNAGMKWTGTGSSDAGRSRRACVACLSVESAWNVCRKAGRTTDRRWSETDTILEATSALAG
jgi:integrase